MRLPCEKVKKKGGGTCITSTFREQKEKGEENYMFHKHGSILPSKLYNFIVDFFWINYWTIQTKKTLTWIKKKKKREIVCFIFISFMIYIMIRACISNVYLICYENLRETISRFIYVNFHLVHKLSTYFCSCSNSLWLKQVFANYRKRALNVRRVVLILPWEVWIRLPWSY